MTAAELIAKLKKFPGDTPVMVAGYEWGYKESSGVNELRLSYQPCGNYGGDWDTADNGIRTLVIS